jgi:DNA-binding NtrC family response regulator
MENAHSPQSDQKTVIVAANDRAVLDFISGFLVRGSYNVLSAGGGEDAIQQMKKYKREIHLLLSTLDMPGTNGLGLAAQVSSKWPSVKVLLMSEFTGGTLILNDGWHFLPKPFIQSQLSALILMLLSPEGPIPK